MATVAHTFSPKEFKCFVISDATNEWEVEVHGYTEEVDANSMKAIRMTRRF